MALRQILVGKGGSTAAPLTLIQGDNHTQIIQMIVQRYYGGVDLGGLTWDVVFENGEGKTDTHYLTDVKVGDANISCNWKPHGLATQAAGLTKFQLEGYAEGEDGAPAMVWQSGVYYFNVSEDMNDTITEEEKAALSEVQELILYVNTQLSGVLQAGTDAAEAAASANTAAADANAATAQAVPAAEAANTAATSATNAAGSANTAATRANTAAEVAEAARDNIQADLNSLKERMPVVGNDPESHYMLEQSDIDDTLSVAGKVADAKVVGDKLGEMHAFVTPEMFGAIGDGVTDDSAAIQAMLDVGGMCLCSRTYLIKQDIRLYKDGTSDTHAYPRSIVKGKNGAINQLDSSATTEYLSNRPTTFIFEGGGFLVKNTCQVEFDNCVFMGSLNAEDMTQTAFKCASPFRKLQISNSTFVNLNYAVYGEVATGNWCGEHTFENLYFALCKNCIHIEKGGLDSRVCKCIVQGNCENFLYLTDATGCMIVENHDYSRYGSVLHGAFIFSSNYIDGLGKLAVRGQAGDNSTTIGPTITGNLFMASVTKTEMQYAIRVIDMLFGATIAGNTFMGGQSGKIILLDMRDASYFQANKIFANSGRIMGYVNDSTASKYATANAFDSVGMEWLTPSGVPSHKTLITCGEGVVGLVRIPSPSQSATGIVLQLNGLPCRVVNEITIGHTDGSVEYDFTTGNVINTTKYSDMAYIVVKSIVRFGASDRFSIPFHVAP